MSRTMSSASSSTAINGHAAAAVAQTSIINESGNVNGEPKKPFKPQWPLTSWADTRQNSVAISFLLGSIFAIGISNGLKLFSSDDLVKHAAQLSSRERFWYAITGPRLGIYLAIQVLFHMMEFFTTAIYNPSQATVKCEYLYPLVGGNAAIKAERNGKWYLISCHVLQLSCSRTKVIWQLMLLLRLSSCLKKRTCHRSGWHTSTVAT